MKNFKELRIWQKGIEIAVKSYQATETFPAHEKFGLSHKSTEPVCPLLPILLKAAAGEV